MLLASAREAILAGRDPKYATLADRVAAARNGVLTRVIRPQR
jgi:hypothetical protein